MSSTMPRDSGGLPIPVLKPGRTVTHSITAASTEVDLGSLFDPDSTAKAFRLVGSVNFNLRTAAGAATTADMFMAADMSETFKLSPTEVFRVIGSAGTLWITEML